MSRTINQSGRSDRDREAIGQLSPSVEQQINENLKRLYDQASEEPLPDHLLKLLAKLKQESSPR